MIHKLCRKCGFSNANYYTHSPFFHTFVTKYTTICPFYCLLSPTHARSFHWSCWLNTSQLVLALTTPRYPLWLLQILINQFTTRRADTVEAQIIWQMLKYKSGTSKSQTHANITCTLHITESTYTRYQVCFSFHLTL